jgi:uncharacterized membrane protein
MDPYRADRLPDLNVTRASTAILEAYQTFGRLYHRQIIRRRLSNRRESGTQASLQMKLAVTSALGTAWGTVAMQRNRGSLSMLVQEPSGNVVSSGDLQGEQRRRPIAHSGTRALLHRGFIGAGGVLLIAAFGTDYTYYTTALWQWANFSAWLITAGLIVTLVAAILLVIDFATGRARRLNTGSFVLVIAAALLSLVNAFVHSRDAWSSVVPQGILLSAVSTLLLLIAGARGWSLAMSRGIGDCP